MTNKNLMPFARLAMIICVTLAVLRPSHATQVVNLLPTTPIGATEGELLNAAEVVDLYTGQWRGSGSVTQTEDGITRTLHCQITGTNPKATLLELKILCARLGHKRSITLKMVHDRQDILQSFITWSAPPLKEEPVVSWSGAILTLQDSRNGQMTLLAEQDNLIMTLKSPEIIAEPIILVPYRP